jgi:hypothetical protein
MATIHSLNQTGTVGEAVGYVAEAVEAQAMKIAVILVFEDGSVEAQGFGIVTVPDLTFFAAFLQKRAMQMADGD